MKKIDGRPSTKEIINLVFGWNGEPVLRWKEGCIDCPPEVLVGNYDDIRTSELANKAAELVEREEFFVIESSHFQNFGVFDPEVGIGYWDVFGKLVHGFLWSSKTEHIEWYSRGGNRNPQWYSLSTEAMLRLSWMFNNGEAVVELWGGCASSVPIGKYEHVAGSGNAQRAIVEYAMAHIQARWDFYSSLTGWVDSRMTKREVLRHLQDMEKKAG